MNKNEQTAALAATATEGASPVAEMAQDFAAEENAVTAAAEALDPAAKRPWPEAPVAKRSHRRPRIVTTILLMIWAAVQIFPLYWMIGFSLKDNAEIFGGNVIGLPAKWLFSNYTTALGSAMVGRYLLNSVIVTAASIALTLLLSLTSTYALNRMRWKGREAMRFVFMLGLMIPMHAALVPLYTMFSRFGLTNTYWSLILPYTAYAVPMGVMMMTGFIGNIPHDMEEAACIDGCGIYGIVFRIMLPMMLPALATVAIFTFLQCWNELMLSYTFCSKDAVRTLTSGIQNMYGQYTTDWGPIGAALVIATVPTLIIYLCMSNQVQKSLIAGAVKG